MTVLEVDGRPVGYLQHFFVRDKPEDFALIGDDEAVAIDYLIGETDLSGGGLGPQMIWRYVREVVLPAYPSVPRVIACPEPENTRSVRALEKAGFVPGLLLTTPTGEPAEQICTFDVRRLLG
jgi:RimJ/RimL family protein N-acetyltransferase